MSLIQKFYDQLEKAYTSAVRKISDLENKVDLLEREKASDKLLIKGYEEALKKYENIIQQQNLKSELLNALQNTNP